MSTSSISTLDDDSNAVAATKVAPSPEFGALRSRHDETLSGERKILTIHAEKGDGGNHAVFVGLNGFPYQIPRNVPCNVPTELVGLLDNAQTDSFDRNEKTGDVEVRTSPRFAYSVKDAPSQSAAPAAGKATAAKK